MCIDLVSLDRSAEARSFADQVLALDEKPHTGLLVSLPIPIDTANAIAVDEGEAPNEMHITLAYCGDVANLGQAGIEEAMSIVEAIANTWAPLSGQIGGIGCFSPSESSDNRSVIIALPDIPHLSALREQVASRLSEAGIPPRTNHGWTPHVTLRYIDGPVPPIMAMDTVPVTLEAIRVSAGEVHREIPLTGSGVVQLSASPVGTPAKKRRKPVYWNGVKLARTPTVFEAHVLSLSEIPTTLSTEVQMAAEAIEQARLAHSHEVAQRHTARVLEELSTRVARYGAQEVDREVERQGGDVLSLDDHSLITDAVVASAEMSGDIGATAEDLSRDWRRTTRMLKRSVTRARGRHADQADASFQQMRTARAKDGILPALVMLANNSFRFGRRTQQGAYVARERVVSLASKRDDYESDDEFVADLTDYVVHTGIQDLNQCDRCAEIDGEIFEFGSDEQQEAEPPYYLCDGRDRCRCLHVLVVGNWRDKSEVRDAVTSDRLEVATERQAKALIRQRQRLQRDEEE